MPEMVRYFPLVEQLHVPGLLHGLLWVVPVGIGGTLGSLPGCFAGAIVSVPFPVQLSGKASMGLGLEEVAQCALHT